MESDVCGRQCAPKLRGCLSRGLLEDSVKRALGGKSGFHRNIEYFGVLTLAQSILDVLHPIAVDEFIEIFPGMLVQDFRDMMATQACRFRQRRQCQVGISIEPLTFDGRDNHLVQLDLRTIVQSRRECLLIRRCFSHLVKLFDGKQPRKAPLRDCDNVNDRDKQDIGGEGERIGTRNIRQRENRLQDPCDEDRGGEPQQPNKKI